MNSGNSIFQYLNLKNRKLIHFSLLLCLLFIQLLIAGFFYNEFISRKNLHQIERKINEMQALENLTNASKQHLLEAQGHLQNFAVTQDNAHLKQYFTSLNSIGETLESLEKNGKKYPVLNHLLSSKKNDSAGVKNLKKLIDSTYKTTITKNVPITEKVLPSFQKYKLDYNFKKFDVETKTVSDTVKKKGLLGRLGDAIAGKENVRKESTVVTIKEKDNSNSEKIKAEFDSIINVINQHYSKEFKTVQVNIVENKTKEKQKEKDDIGLFKIFNNLLVYSNGLMGVYEGAINDSKKSLEQEYNKQNSKNNTIRNYIVFSAMILMFIVSILIFFLTRLAFIYEQKLNDANQQIKQNLNFKNRILGMLSHELRSPLKMVDIFIKRIHKKTNDDDVKEYLKSISFTNNSLLIQANQILEYTKNQHIENKLVPVVFNLHHEINAILTAIQPYVEARHNQFVVHQNIDPSIEVYSDNAKIHQLYLNIIGNANKFTENGTVTVNAFADVSSEGLVMLTTEVKDTGAGISKSDLQKIFEPYYQGVLSGDVENLGAGLGLSLCKEIIELFSGEISAESTPNQGTTLRFKINLKRHT